MKVSQSQVVSYVCEVYQICNGLRLRVQRVLEG